MDRKSLPTDIAPIEVWFEFGSNYSYLSVMRIEEVAAGAGVEVRFRPFLLGPIFRGFGWQNSPFVLQKEKGAYVWKDMERQCRKYGLPWTRPTVFPRSAVLPLRIALIASSQPWMGTFCRRVMRRNFVEDRDIDSIDAMREVLIQLDLPAQEILEEAQSEANKLRLRQQTEAAREKGIFGAPTFFVGEEMFWGNDRLEDALEVCRLGELARLLP